MKYKRLNQPPTKSTGSIHFFALAGLFTGVLAGLEFCGHAPKVIRVCSCGAVAVTVALAVADVVTCSHPCTMAAVSAARDAVGPALAYICALDTLAGAQSRAVALGRTFRDATMNATSWRPLCCWFPHPAHNQSHTNGSSSNGVSSLKSRGTQSHLVISCVDMMDN
jgi:hypothetical protein